MRYFADIKRAEVRMVKKPICRSWRLPDGTAAKWIFSEQAARTLQLSAGSLRFHVKPGQQRRGAVDLCFCRLRNNYRSSARFS